MFHSSITPIQGFFKSAARVRGNGPKLWAAPESEDPLGSPIFMDIVEAAKATLKLPAGNFQQRRLICHAMLSFNEVVCVSKHHESVCSLLYSSTTASKLTK